MILDNVWVTKGVYQILDNSKIHKQKGHFSLEDAKANWLNTKYEDMYYELLELMKKFEICYQIDGTRQFVCPVLFPKEKPIYEWDESKNLCIDYVYDLIPKGLLSRLIVRLYQEIKDKDNLAWKTGCIFIYENTEAQIIETKHPNKIEIRIKGRDCKSFAVIIMREIEKLNESFRELSVQKMVPCNCEKCEKSNTPHAYKYDVLLDFKNDNIHYRRCEKSRKEVPINGILDGVYDNEEKSYSTIRSMLERGKIEEALKLRAAIIPESDEEEVEYLIMLKSKYYAGIKNYSMGKISIKDWDIICQEITYALLEITKAQITKDSD